MMPAFTVRTRIKICGLTRRQDVEAALGAGADALGFILAESVRSVSMKQAAGLIRDLPPFVSTVAVVADPSYGFLNSVIESGLFSHIQFHGHETPDIFEGIPLKKIKVFGISPTEQMPDTEKYDKADYFLFDAKVGNAQGGTGRTIDWDRLRAAKIGKPFILAGGLGPDNVADAIRMCRPSAVDLNSCLESALGVKDAELIRKAVMEVRIADLSIRE